MKKILKLIGKTLIQFGLNPLSLIQSLRFVPRYFVGLFYFMRNSKDLKIKSLYPQLLDYFDGSGVASGHYFHQDIIVARWIYNDRPNRHVDIASRVDGFISHLAVFRDVEIFDIRPLSTNESNISFVCHNMMEDSTIRDLESVSCLHSIEHFGLGRYGDPLDFNGHLKGFSNICSMLRPGGIFYFSTPVGPLRIEFNAHRVFSVSYILDNFIFKNNMEIMECALVDDNSNVFLNLDIHDGVQNNFKCNYGVLIMKLKKV
jgi:SAM-dependent methyltransferase